MKFLQLEHFFDLIIPGVKIYKSEFPSVSEIGTVKSYQSFESNQGYNAQIILEIHNYVFDTENNPVTPYLTESTLIKFKYDLKDYFIEADDFVFIKGGDTGTGLSFGDAIVIAQRGYAIQRKGWNGKNMFVAYMPHLHLPPFNTQDTSRKVNDRTAKWIGEDAELNCNPYFAMYTDDKKWQPGWLASQSDMLAHDWEIFK